jgi:hypothetical protein
VTPGKKAHLYRDPDTPNPEHIINGGNIWPRDTAREQAAKALGVQPDALIGVKVTLTFFDLEENGQPVSA